MKKPDRKKPAKKSKSKQPPLAQMRQVFAGTQMSNFLFALTQNYSVPQGVREQAGALQKKWDSVSAYRINNPITAAEMEAKLFGKATGAGK
jgi:hypothetical protein